MKDVLKATGSVLLGLVVIAAVLLAFSPIGDFLCGPSECTTEDHPGWVGRPWALFGFVGFMGTFMALVVLAALFMVGEWTKERAEDAKFEINTWYLKRQLAARKLASLEDNGGRPDNPVNLNDEGYDF